jgi:hypothetical protein
VGAKIGNNSLTAKYSVKKNSFLFGFLLIYSYLCSYKRYELKAKELKYDEKASIISCVLGFDRRVYYFVF